MFIVTKGMIQWTTCMVSLTIYTWSFCWIRDHVLCKSISVTQMLIYCNTISSNVSSSIANLSSDFLCCWYLGLNALQTSIFQSLKFLISIMISMLNLNHVIWFHVGKHNINCNRIQASRGKWRETLTGIIHPLPPYLSPCHNAYL